MQAMLRWKTPSSLEGIMALQHAKPGEIIALTCASADTSAFASIALAKTEEMELIRLVLPAGKEMHEHHVKGDITFQCLSGEIAFVTRGTPTTLKAGEMLYVEGGTPHAVRALADSVALLTIVLRH